MGDTDKADALATEAEKLTDELQIPHFLLAKRVSALGQAFDPTEAEGLLREAETSNNLEVIAAICIIRATKDPSLTDTRRLELLEQTHSRLAAAPGCKPMLQPVRFAIGRQLARMGEPQRAIQWFKKILTSDPLDRNAGGELVNCLWKTEKWGEAATFLRGLLDLAGNKPGILFAYGKSLFESGDMSGAVSALAKSSALADPDSDLKNTAMALRERAFELGGTVLPLPASFPGSRPVTREEFELALNEFGRFISEVKRMTFWTKKERDYDWIERPENWGQHLLHTFLQARFGERVEIFPELPTGAGRLDLYLKFSGGLAVVLELKMCGFRYSSPYAAAGEEQINHYMDNRKTNLGYLVVFDARLDAPGRTLLSEIPSSAISCFESY